MERTSVDRERYARIREIAAEMMARQTDLPLEQVKGWFCNETGYQTPKLATMGRRLSGGAHPAGAGAQRVGLCPEAGWTWTSR